MMGWLTANWKVISAIGMLFVAAGTASIDHVSGADTRFTEIETQAKMKAVRDSATISVIQQDVADVKCIVVHQAQGTDPLGCIE